MQVRILPVSTDTGGVIPRITRALLVSVPPEFCQDGGNARSDVSDSKYESTAGAVMSVT